MDLTKARHVYFNHLPNLLILAGIFLLGVSFGPLIKDEIWYSLKESKSQQFQIVLSEEYGGTKQTAEELVPDNIFSRFLSSRPIRIDPVNKDFGLVIEKIGVNVPVVKNVSVADEQAYVDALKGGVAHARVSSYPSKSPGNTYIFAHASLNFFRLGKYATVFNLLRKLEKKDEIYVFYENKAYLYEVVGVESVKGWDLEPILRPVIEPTLTLQTCDPPGTTLNRLVVTARLKEVLGD